MYRHLFVPIDDSDLSVEVIGNAVALARPLGARITFFHAVADAAGSLRGDAELCALDARVRPATEADWSTEYLDAILACRVVSDIDAAIAHITHYGSGHTESIIASDVKAAEQFLHDLDSAILPTRGASLALQTAAGHATQAGGPNGPFARLYGRLTGYLPLWDRWYGTARVELGHIAHGSGVQVPDALGFRAGGDDSVRGYAYRALAPTDAGGGTVSGQRLLTASLEVARPIVPSIPSVWGALFIDAGRAVTEWNDYTPAWGYGAGIRWRSPIGPLRVDLAWADELKKLRLHFSVGIAF